MKLVKCIPFIAVMLVCCSSCKENEESKGYIPTYNLNRSLTGYTADNLSKTKALSFEFVNEFTKLEEEIVASPISYIYSLGLLSQVSVYEGEELYKDLGFESNETLKSELDSLNQGLNFTDGDYKSRLSSAFALDLSEGIKTDASEVLNDLAVAVLSNSDEDFVNSWYSEATFKKNASFPFDVRNRISLFSTYTYACSFNDGFKKGEVSFNDENVAGFTGSNYMGYKDTDNYVAVSIPTRSEKLILLQPKSDEFSFDISMIENTSFKRNKVNLSAPSFEKKATIDLKDYTKDKLGLDYLFTKNSFTKIAKASNYINNIKQTTTFSMNENGVYASSTAIFQTPTADSEKEIDVAIDKSFIYVLVDSAGIPLFFGTVNNL